MKIYKQPNGLTVVMLPGRFTVGFGYECGMVKRFVPWRWDTYAWFQTSENGTWHFRFLWFYFGRASKEGLRFVMQRYFGRKNELSS